MRNLTTSKLLRYAERYHADTEIVSYFLTGQEGVYTQLDVHRYTYQEMASRCRQFANQLLFFSSKPCVIGVLSCNTYRHLEMAYAVTGAGKIYMPLNPKFDLDRLRYIIRHSEMKYCYYERAFVGIVHQLQEHETLTQLQSWVCIEDNYQKLLDFFNDDLQWPSFIETTPAMLCYTSGTTSKPKGVVYTHRDLLLSAMMAISPDGCGLSAVDTLLPIPGMHHSGCWGLMWMALMVGCKLVLIDDYGTSHSFMDRFTDILDCERVTVSAGIPSFWTYFLEYLLVHNYTSRFQHLYLDKIIVGGFSIHPLLSLRFKQFDIQIISLYGMTETLFCGFYSTIKHQSGEETYELFLDRLRPLFGMDVKIDEEDHQWISGQQGEVFIRSLWSSQQYYKARKGLLATPLVNGWFPTQDIGTMSKEGYLTVIERKQDIVRVLGSWTSSLLMENIAMGHPNVLQCAVVGVCDPLIGELCVIVVKTREPMLETEIIKLYADRQLMPGYVLFTDSFPMTTHDKIDKEWVKQMVYNVLNQIA